MMSSNILTQGFGKSKACIYPNRRVVPKFGAVCRAGTKDLYKSIGMKGHNGADWGAYHTEPIYFSTLIRGMKWWAKTEVDTAGGIGVDVVSKTKVNIGGALTYIKFRFWHLNASLVADGQDVHLGQRIGLAGTTGLSSGTHLHFAYKFCLKDGTAINKGNGYFGGLDPAPFMQEISIIKYKKIDEKLTLPQEMRKIAYFFVRINFDIYNALNRVASIIEKKVGGIFRSLTK